MADSAPRKRSRAACLSCQARKRKCSGEKPCVTCIHAGVDCQYSSTSRRKQQRTGTTFNEGLRMLQQFPQPLDGRSSAIAPKESSAAGSTASPASHTRSEQPHHASQSLEVNSGAAFVRKLGLRIDPANAPRLNLFAWNVGQRRLSPTFSSATTVKKPITSMLSQEEMRRLATVYFEKVDTCYPFLDRKSIFQRIAHRWNVSTPDDIENEFDAVLYGVAAFGFLFSRRDIVDTERHLVEAARLLLEKSILCAETPSIDTVAGWVLRAAYLRMTASPHAAWMASCTLMHMVEAAGIHLESTDPESTGLIHGPSNPPNPSPQNDTDLTKPLNTPDSRRRLYGMARHLNTWISYDLGRSRVILHGAPTRAWPLNPHSTLGSRPDLFHLLPLSENLDPTGPTLQDLPELEAALTSVLDILYTEQSLILVQCNLMLCIYRRIRALNAHPPLSSKLLDRVLALAARGLRAARGMAASTCPWHQVANVPFQVVCTLLAIDNRAALALLPDAMQTLREVFAAYETDAMREAYSTAYLLIALHQRRKEDDTRALGDVLRANAGAAEQKGLRHGGLVGEEQGRQEQQQPQQQQPSLPMGNAPVPNLELSWLGDLVIDMPSLQNFDLDQFLMTDVPWPLPEMGL
ncbi:hypothetical protein N7468_008095 [Penicillium chermesinum]|uniref:Zn(2)-C6 fungal-type domain-containing protein n=1 Tax=Penicillium chermesinum TaxID=63820 RepID=A0A9W9NRF8_9EURO|nr:uncharacterized protein N7468_008095 [Penicillium chermesinum]KAJ5223553.1 hypothetical protein N7468_008095 [Penicillium chermesinum]